MNLNQLFESLSADQRRVGQLPANFRAPNTSPQLSGPYPGRNATRGYLVGEQGVSEGHADQQRKIVKRNGKPVGEVGIDRESSPGVGQYYMKHYASDTDNSGYDSFEEALGDLKYIMKQSVYGELQGQGVSENTVKGKPFQKTMVRPEEAYKLLAGQEPKAFAIDVLMPDQSAVKRLQAAIGNQAKIRGDDSIAGDGVGIQIVPPVFPDGRTAQQAFEMMMDVIRTHGGGFNRSTGAIIAAPASQDVAEAMKPSDIPPSMRQRLTMRDIEAERPQGAYRFRVTFPDGATADFMDFEAAQERAAADRGRISRLSEEKKKSNPRIERILKMLRARHPQAEDDLEALIYDFRSQQAQDRTDIARLDRENDMEEADIERLEQMLDVIRRRRGVEPVAEPVQEDDIDDAMRDFLARGGKIQQEPTHMPRLGTRLRQHGSRHIGQGREGRAGQLSGRGANTNPGSNKPVVTAESLRDDEYHVATVTLDDGSVKRVRITTDEGFRDRIQQHFRKQGRTVKDIDVDFSVRSKFDENKPTFTGAPARPQPAPMGATKTLPPAPGRPGMMGGPRAQQRDLEQDLARRMAAEDVLGDVKRRLGDVLKQREQRRAARMPAKQMPQDVLGDPVKKIDLGDGKVLMIHGNEDDGFRIHLGQRVMPTRFATMEQAEMATRMFEAKRDACYNKVRSRYKVWPSAYASGALVQCRKKGADNWGKGSKD